jgi:hypothetical protein
MSTKPTQVEGCLATTFERKYYHRGNVFIKRSLRPSEYRTGYHGLHVPRLGKERIKNEAESLRFVRQHTDIPVPTVYCDFEDDQAYYLITEYVDDVGMSELFEEQKAIVCKELEGHIAKLQSLRSCRPRTTRHRHSSVSRFAANRDRLQGPTVLDTRGQCLLPQRSVAAECHC